MPHAILPSLTAILLISLPLVLLLVALTPTKNARHASRATQAATTLALGLALLAAVSYFFGLHAPLRWALPGSHDLLALSVAVNGLTVILATLVSFVLMIIARYSHRYLAGDPAQARFFRLLSLIGSLFLLAVVVDNLGVFALALFGLSFPLYHLLAFYADRPLAVMAAHKNRFFNHAADVFLFAGTGLIAHQVGSLEFSQINAYATATSSTPPALYWAVWLLTAAVILKSAQFPFHGWLIQVMEAPTPVSALMHAGIVYGGAILVLRTSELFALQGQSLYLLALVGLLTLTIGSAVMLTQTAIKSVLAWSTAAQLGFMLLEQGLGLYALALLHLTGHALYKAHAFLASGSLTDQLRYVQPQKRRSVGIGVWALTLLASLGTSLLLAAAWGLSWQQEPALLAIGVIVGFAAAQLVLKSLTHASLSAVITSLGIALGMMVIYYGLHHLFAIGLQGDLAALHGTLSLPYAALLGLVVLAFAFLAWLQGPGRAQLRPFTHGALFVHLYNGLYLDHAVERLIYRLWPERVAHRRPERKHRHVLPRELQP